MFEDLEVYDMWHGETLWVDGSVIVQLEVSKERTSIESVSMNPSIEHVLVVGLHHLHVIEVILSVCFRRTLQAFSSPILTKSSERRENESWDRD
jgi:hypothetical protein